MASMMKMADIVSTMKDAVGEVSERGLNERISRLNLLLNKNRMLVTDETAKYKLRYRQSLPTQIAISVVTVFQNNACDEGTRRVCLQKHDLIRETCDELWTRFKKYYDQSSVALSNYFPRLISTGFLEKMDHSTYRLGDDYDCKIVNLLAPTEKVSTWNTYIKAMAQTVGCAILTEKEPWQYTPCEVAEKVNVELISEDILSWLYPSERTASVHIYPLHHDQEVEFYANNVKGKLGIPAVHSKLEKEIYRYQDPQVDDKAIDQIVDDLTFLQHLPVISFPALTEYSPITKKYIERHWTDQSFPFAIVPPTGVGPRVLLPKARIHLLNELGGYSYSKCSLGQDLSLWHALPDLVGVAMNHAAEQDQIKEGILTLEDCLRRLLDEAPISPSQTTPLERHLLGVMVEYGLARDNEKGEFFVKNREQLSLLQEYLTLWRKRT